MGGVWADTSQQFEAFYAEDYERVVAQLGAQLGDRELARDAVGEAISRAWERQQAGEVVDNLGGWIRTVALNCARDALRRRKTRDRAARRLQDETLIPLSDDLVEGLDLEKAIEKLAPRQREIARLRFIDDLSYDQIGARLGIAPGTAKNIARRARYLLLAALVLAIALVFVPKQFSKSKRVEISNPSTTLPKDGASATTVPRAGTDNRPTTPRRSTSPARDDVGTPGAPGVGSATPAGTGSPSANGSSSSDDSGNARNSATTPTTGVRNENPGLGEVKPTSFVHAIQTHGVLTLDKADVAYGDIQFSWVDEGGAGAARLRISDPSGVAMSLPSGGKQVLRLGVGTYTLCAATCAPFNVVAPTLAEPREQMKDVTIAVGDDGLSAPYRTIGTDVPQLGAGTVSAPDRNGRWAARPKKSHTVILVGAAGGTHSWTVQVGDTTYTVAPGERVLVRNHAPHLTQFTDIAVSGQSSPSGRLRLL
jgi:RNA polymerase sigma-70 factor (ECF subfamily)